MMAVADYVLTIMVTLAVIGNVLVLRSSHQEPFLVEAGRRIGIAGCGLMSLRWWYLLFVHEGLSINPLAVMGMTLVFTSISLSAFHKLFGEEVDAYFENKNLFGSQHHDS